MALVDDGDRVGAVAMRVRSLGRAVEVKSRNCCDSVLLVVCWVWIWAHRHPTRGPGPPLAGTSRGAGVVVLVVVDSYALSQGTSLGKVVLELVVVGVALVVALFAHVDRACGG